MEFNIYKYNTLAEAEIANSLVNNHFGFPINENAITQNYTEIKSYENFFYINYLAELLPILGEPIIQEMTLNL